jgi:hypothetical protein
MSSKFGSLPYDPVSLVPSWFEAMKGIRDGTVLYDEITKTERIRPPVRSVCQLLKIKGLNEVLDDDVLYKAIERVAEMQIEEENSRLDDVPFDSTNLLSTSGRDIIKFPDVPDQPISITSRRPPGLAALLDLVNESNRKSLNKYIEFLTGVNTIQQELYEACIAVRLRFKLTDSVPGRKAPENSSLYEVFNHYAAMGVNPKSKLDEENATLFPRMTMKAIIAFCTDFELCPRLLSASDVALIVQVMSIRNIGAGKPPLTKLDLENFKEFLVRLALFAYHSPSLKRIILAMNDGYMPANIQLVEYICHYLHLGDNQYVRNKLNSLRKKIIAIANTFGSDFSVPIEKHRLIRKHRDNHYEGVEIRQLPFLKERERQNTELRGIKSKAPPKPLPKSVEAMFKQQSNALGMVDKNNSKSTHSRNTTGTSGHGHPADAQDEGEEHDQEQSQAGNDPDHEQGQGQGLGQVAEETHSTASSVGSTLKWEQHVSEEQRQLVAGDLEKSLMRCVGKFALRRVIKELPTDWFASGGAFLDMGRLEVGAEYVIQVQVTNQSADPIILDATCAGFEALNTRVRIKPSSLAPGLTRSIDVLFNVDAGEKAVLAMINIYTASPKTGESLCFEIPVHYRVGPPVPERDDFLCCVNNLDFLSRKFIGERPIKTIDFHRENDPFGAMTLPPFIATTKRFAVGSFNKT